VDEPVDRESAISALQAAGFIASARDWAMGRTIFVTRADLLIPGDISAYRRIAYLRQDAVGWTAASIVEEDRHFESFAQAVAHIRHTLETEPGPPSARDVTVAEQLIWAMENVLAWHVPHPVAGRQVFRSTAELLATWTAHGGEPSKLPQVDFSRSMVIGIFAGEGTFRSVPTIASIDSLDGMLRIRVAQRAMAYDVGDPASVVVIDRDDRPVVFADEHASVPSMILNFTPGEKAALLAATDRLHKLGWADHVDVEQLLGRWAEFPTEASEYSATVDDYTNDLTMRDAIEIVLGEAAEPLRGKLLQFVGDVDARFRAATVEDSRGSLNRYLRVREGWWWKRIPAAGALARYLATDGGQK
jgi:hypothetical protein